MIHLAIGNVLLFSPSLINSRSLIRVFHQLQSIDLRSKFRLDYASKLIEHFPSLIHLEFDVDSAAQCKSLLGIVLNSLPKLNHITIHFLTNSLLGDETYLIDYVFQIRCQAYPHHLHERKEICVKITEKLLDIYLNGCVICARSRLSWQ